ncbi:HDOD domain-containing protein [Desulfopila sp. IMCC35008]|uniref:HDOD domain-containing protein n=1 Tax=Desulfopila sp. IMCC35008 TaxID=2653858 RepID=UPI0013D1973B|nr:HDOD domain-containing protein [Desulfopila sp. IMCC35008]
MYGKQQVISEIEKCGNLPTLPHILLKLLAICDVHDVNIAYLTNTITKDPAICTEVLRLVNSAYYGLHQPIKSIKQAVVYLGPKTIQNMVVIMSIHQTFRGKRYRSRCVLDTEVFWYHSLMCATLAKRLCHATSCGNSDEVYLAGLLHDIGKLILASTFQEKYSLVTEKNKTGSSLLSLEEEGLGINHCEVGSWLVRQWKMSSLVADSILYHHHPFEQIRHGFPLVKIIYVANLLLEEEQNSDQVFSTCNVLLGLDRKDIEQILEETNGEVRNIADQMNIRHIKTVSAPHLEPHNARTDTDSQSPKQPFTDSEAAFGAMEKELSAHVKNVSLLATVLDNLVLAPDVKGILAALEKSFNLLFGIDKTLFLLPDKKGLLLKGRTSETNPLHQVSKGIRLPIHNSSSAIVRSYNDMSSPAYLTEEQQPASLADVQIRNIFDSDSLLLIPLTMDGKPIGIVVATPPYSNDIATSNDLKLINTVTRQVSLRLHLENQKAIQAEKVQAEKMAAVSMAARKFAHEINNPLGIISNYLAGMKLKMADQNELQHELKIIDEEIHRISAMVNQMDMFSQAPFSEFKQTDINKTIDNIVQLSRLSLFDTPEKTLAFIPGTNLPFITTSPSAIKQILINLIKNAAEAMENKGRVIVRTKKSQDNHVGESDGIEIVVADTGPGLPEYVRAHLYQPLITTKQTGHSGLGLSIVSKAVNDIGATLTCKSSESEGTTFTIYLPNSLTQSPRTTGENNESYTQNPTG